MAFVGRSGAGKTTISRMLMQADRSISMSVSATTRPMRPGEVDGVDYHFVDDATFQRLVDTDELAEWAYVFGHRYGSPKEPIKEALKNGLDTLFDIDWQGTQQLYQKDRQDVVSVFILPPTIDELRRRLESRAQDSGDVIEARMERARAEISHWAEYDYVLINDDLDQTEQRLRAILTAERLRRDRQGGLGRFVKDLMEEHA